MIYSNQLLCSYHPHPTPPPPAPTAELRLRRMKSTGNRCIGTVVAMRQVDGITFLYLFFNSYMCGHRSSRKLIKASTHVPFPRKATQTINCVWKGGPDPAFPLVFHENLASRASVIRLSRIAFSVPYPNLGEFHSGSSQIPYPVDISRIPLFNSAQPRIPGLPLNTLNQYWLFR